MGERRRAGLRRRRRRRPLTRRGRPPRRACRPALLVGSRGTYYLGLDGDKRPIESVASNAGHLLWAGAVPADRARSVAHRLLEEDMWSGWGVRTLSTKHAAYNPLSYQLGSVWPHDNAIIANGLARYGHSQEAA